MTEIVIRAREPSDLTDLVEVWNQPRVVWGTLQLPHTSLEARRKREQETPATHVHLVAVIDGKAIGEAGMYPVSPARRRAHVAAIGMGVHDAYAGRGAGRLLLASLLELADRWHAYSRVELTVWADNARAINLYEQAGFEREGLHKHYGWRDGAYVDALAMARLRPN